MNHIIKNLVAEARKHGCTVDPDVTDGNPYSVKITTPNALFDDAKGKFEFLITNANCENTQMCYGYYILPCGGQFCCGNDSYNTNLGYEELINQMHIDSGTCDHCHEYFGADKLHGVAFANKACDNCVDALRAKLETPGWCD